MNKFFAKVRVKREKNAESLVKAFFQEFNPQSNITIQGEEAKMEIFFEDPPVSIINAIYSCEVIEFYYGKKLDTYEEIDSETKVGKIEKKEKDEQREESKDLNLQELDKIAEKAKSFEDFAQSLSEQLEMGKQKEYFANLIIVSTEVNKIKWKELEEALDSKNISYTEMDKIWARRKLKKYGKNIIPVLKAIRQYKNYPFKNEKIKESNLSKKNEIIKKKGSMTNEFYEILTHVDKTKPIDERVRFVLEGMGLTEIKPEKQKQFLNIASSAVKKKNINIDSVLAECNISKDEAAEEQMEFVTFVNAFVERYDKEKKVKLVTFLTELQEGIAD